MADETVSALAGTVSLDFWDRMWSEQKSGWHEADGNSCMWKQLLALLKQLPTKKPEEVRVFVPLCGKAVDMYKLYQLGFTVVGVEFARQAIDEFFAENQLQEKPGATPPFRSTQDGRLIVGEGDLFTFGGDGSRPNQLPFDKYDIVWDRASFEAINKSDRQKYGELMMSLMSQDCVYLIGTCRYDVSEYGGPPLSADTEDLKVVFGGRLDVRLLEEYELPEQAEAFGVSRYFEQVHLMTNRQ